MKCIIFAAGFATRLYPLTLHTPKPLLLINGTPIIEHIISTLDPHKSIKDVFIVTNAKFYSQFEEWKNKFSSRFAITLVNDGTSNQDERMGAIGDLKYVISTQQISDDLLLIAGDNLFEDSLADLIAIFDRHKKPVIGVYDIGSEELASNYGVVEVNRSNVVTSFEEKPIKATTSLIATFVYAIPARCIAHIHEYAAKYTNLDRAGDFIKYLSSAEDVVAVPFDGHWFDIGTIDQFEKANRYFSNR